MHLESKRESTRPYEKRNDLLSSSLWKTRIGMNVGVREYGAFKRLPLSMCGGKDELGRFPMKSSWPMFTVLHTEITFFEPLGGTRLSSSSIDRKLLVWNVWSGTDDSWTCQVDRNIHRAVFSHNPLRIHTYSYRPFNLSYWSLNSVSPRGPLMHYPHDRTGIEWCPWCPSPCNNLCVCWRKNPCIMY